MKVNLTGRNYEIPKSLKDLVEKKLEKLMKIEEKIIEATVTMIVEKHNHIVELSVKDQNSSYVASEKSNSMAISLRRAFNAIEKQIKRSKKKIIKKKRRGEQKPIVETVPLESEFAITRSNDYFPKPLSLEEAVKYFNSNKKEILVFRNLDSKKFAVLFKRKDGIISLIEPDF